MTSTNDGKDVKSYQANAQKGKTYYIEFYKSLEAGLSSDCGLRGRTKYLCEAWRRIHSLCQHSTSSTHPHLLSWLQRHTAKIILQTEWQSSASKNEHVSLTEAINDFISESQAAIKARDGASTLWEAELLQRAEWFKKTLLSPWGHATLKKLLDPQNGSPSDEEFVEWLKEERGIMVVTRLRQLAASKCDDLALSLAAALMDRVRAGIEPHTDADQSNELKEKPKPVSSEPKFAELLKSQAGFTADIWELLVDIEFVLLHKCDKRSRCIELAKQIPLRTCYQLVERLENRLENSPKEKKLWKNAREVARLIAQVTIARCMVVSVCSGACHRALYWCARALARLVAGARLVADTAALAAPAATSRHLHTLAVAVHAQSTASMKPFVCELYVRAMTAGMNELERLKMKTEKETEARALEQTLSSWFTSLGSLLGGSPRVQCECTLTAFSVHPSPFMYEAIKKAPNLPPLHVDVQEKQEEFISEFGSWANDSRSQTNLVKTSETLNLKHQKQQSNILSTAILTEGEALGLSPELCQDIAVLLSGPRLKTLSWDMDREILLDNCRSYMERTHGGTRALTTELKYLNLDPKEFQHLPEEDDEEENDIFYGIEKGYEHLVEFQPEEIWGNATCSQEHSDSLCSSSLESDITVIKLKKKSRRVSVNLSEDSNPLSLIAEAKRKAKKKERPHSKERNRDSGRKKTLKDPLDIQDHCDGLEKEKSQTNEKKKNKPGRKKKDKLVVNANPLSNLLGMKITKPGETGSDSVPANSIIDSDHESQGKFSLNSINSEISEDVIFDGLYSMDEFKSPDIHTQTDKIELLKNNELCVVNGVMSMNKPSIATHSFNNNTNSESNSGNIASQTFENRNREDCIPSINVSSSLSTNITEEVKKKITRLIDFRRHTKIKHRIPEQSDASSTSSNDSIHTNTSSGIKLPDDKFSNNLMHSDTSSTIKSIEHNSSNSSLHTATPNCIKKQESIISNNYIHSDISNGMRRLDIKKSNKLINSDLSSSINICQNSFLNSLTHSDISNGLKRSEYTSTNHSLCADTSDSMKRPENKSSNYPIATEVPNCIKRFENNFQSHVTPKVVTIPNIPKVFISKKPIKETGQLHVINNNKNVTYPVEHLSEKNDHKMPATHFSMCNPFTNTIAELQLKNGCLNQNVPKEKNMDMAQNHKPNELTPGQSPELIQSYEIPKQNKFQSFLKELQKSINAGAVVNSNKCLATQTDTVRRVVKPVSRVTPVIPTVEKNDIKISQTIQQPLPERFNGHKSIDNSLNTFSRLSYMHKNRQNDSKLKQVVDSLVELHNINLRKCPSSKGLGQTIEDHKKVMTSYVNSKTNANKAVTYSTPCDNMQSITTKSEKFNKPTIHNIEASVSSLKNNMTTGNTQFTNPNFKNEYEIRKKQSEMKLLSDKFDPITSSLSEQDQNDLLLLLRQKNNLNMCSGTKKMVTINTDQNNISMNQSCSSNQNISKHSIDKTTTSKISKNEQVDKAPSTNSSISCVSNKQKIQKKLEVSRPDKNLITSRTTTSIKTPRSLSKNSNCNQHKLKKNEINMNDDLSNDAHNKQLKGTTSTDWESVMNAILAQKTPSRGPNALDVALNKSSFAKAFADSIRNNNIGDNETLDERVQLHDKVIVPQSDLKQNIKSTSKTSHSVKDRRHTTKGQKHDTKRDTKHGSEAKVNKNKIKKVPLSSIEMLNPNCNLEKSLQNSCIVSNALGKKTSHCGTSNRFSNGIQKQFTCPLPQQDDPFISGIANSDYDLLEELMDDDLKQEIGELSSDDDNFNMSTHNALKKSVMALEKHSHNILNKSSDCVTAKSNVSQKHLVCESRIPMPESILKPESRAENICTTAVPANQVYINNNPELKGVAENTKIYNKPLVTEYTQANNLLPNNKENHNKDKMNVKITNEDIISTMVNSSLLINTVVPKTFENMVLIEPGINYEQLSTSQTPLQNNVKPLPGSKYVDINKTSDIPLYQTTPFVPHVVENRHVDIITNRDLPSITPESLSALEIEPSTQFDYSKMIKATPDLLSIDRKELGYTKSESKSSSDNQLNDIFSKKNQTQFNLDIIKNNERKVLSEVQEKQHFLIEKKDQDDLKSTTVAIGNDFEKINDQERLRMKRFCIINRKVHHYSSDKPIPLTYMPLKSSVPNSAKIQIQQDNKLNQNWSECDKPQRLQSLLNVKIHKIQNETKSKISKENKSEKIQDVKKESHKCKKSRDNKSKSTDIRRKFIRSSNKNDNRSIIIHKDLLNGDEKVNRSNQKLSSLDSYELNLNNGKVPKRKISMKSFKDSLNVSKEVDSNGDPLLVKKLTRKKRKKKEKLNNELEQLSTNFTHIDPIDIEDQILVSKIPKNETSGLSRTLESYIPLENSEICLLNTNSNVQAIQTCVEVSKIDAQAESDVTEILDFKQVDDKKTNEKTIENVIQTLVPTQKDYIFKTNKEEKSQDLIDLTLGNKKLLKTSFIDAKNLNQNDLQKEDNLPYSQPQRKEPNILRNRNVQNQICSSKSNNSSSTVQNLSDIPQSYKDSIKIIPLPPDPVNPLRKFVRIKLPNGRSFKATSYGKQDVDFNTLFANPSLKSVLLDGLTDKTRYTLNIKQVATTTIDNSKKVVETRIQEIRLEAKTPSGPIETIDLLSDDEDSVTYQHFKTEFGNFKIRSLENDEFALHQKKFVQDCRVKLFLLNLEHACELNVCDILHGKLNNIENNVSPPQIEKNVCNNVKTTIQNDTNIEINNSDIEINDTDIKILNDTDIKTNGTDIKINDTSDDTSNFITSNVLEEIATLKERINNQTVPVNDVALNSKQSVLSDIDQNILSINETAINSNLDNIFLTSSVPEYGNCYVKLINCDDMVEKYKKLERIKQECVLDFARCGNNSVNHCTQIASTNIATEDIGSLEKQNGENIHKTNVSITTMPYCSFQNSFVGNINKSVTPFKSGRSSPVINAFEEIAALKKKGHKKCHTLVQVIPTYNCVAEWFKLKPQLSLGCKGIKFTCGNRWESDSNKCLSEWHISKPNLSCQIKMTKNGYIENINNYKLDFKSMNTEPNLPITINNNPELYYLKNLKRKLSVDDNSYYGRKITKIETNGNICRQEDTYKAIRNAKSQNDIDNLETESFDFLSVCYESDPESDVASNNSESILAEHVNVFDAMIFNEQIALVGNDSKNELVDSKQHGDIFPKNHEDIDKSCVYTELSHHSRTGTPSPHIVQSYADEPVKTLKVDDFPKDIPKKTFEQEQNVSDRSALETNGIIINNEDVKCKASVHKIELQTEIHKINTNRNNDQNKQDKTYAYFDIKQINETSIEDLQDRQLHDNCSDNRDKVSGILSNITSNINVSSISSTDTTVTSEDAPIILETIDGKSKLTEKSITEKDLKCQLPDTLIGDCVKQLDDNDVTKIKDFYLPNPYSGNQTVDNVFKNSFYNEDDKIQITKVTNNYSMEEPLKLNGSKIPVSGISEELFTIKETPTENTQIKMNNDRPRINKGNLDHEYAALYEIKKHVEISKTVKETEEENCVFVIDDDNLLIDDKYENITETIVDMNNDEILHEDYIKNELAFNNIALLSSQIIVEVDCDKVETIHIAQQENNQDRLCTFKSYNKNLTVDVSNSVDSIKKSPAILKSVNDECPNKKLYNAPMDTKSTNLNEKRIVPIDCTKEIVGIYDDKSMKTNLKLLIPKLTYVNKINDTLNDKKNKKTLKRKIGMKDIKSIEKRYRKGKNIDNPFKQFSCAETLYAKEFARLYNYVSSVKFSYSQPFHKEDIDVPKMLTDWPIKGPYPKPIEHEGRLNGVLFVDLENTGLSKATDPLEQTLSEELNSAYEENKYIEHDINENNFNMGFGEGSGRVIQNLEDGEDAKFSAATLSDVKQIQPFLLSEDYDDEDCIQEKNAVTVPNEPKKDDQLNKIRHYLSYIQLKDKVQAFFKKTTKEFNSITERNLKSKQDQDFCDTTIFPFGLTHPDFIEPGPVEAIIHVVQVGQLPVTAAAQNPVTCDPRVTQVSDASPPQCSENSLNDDSQSPIKTEYTELTTADLSLPLLQDYATATHNQVTESHENLDMPISSENIPIETEIKSVVKIELMEELSEEKIDQNENSAHCESPETNREMLDNVDYTFDTNSMNATEATNHRDVYNSEEKDYDIAEEFVEQKQQANSAEKTDQIAHAMNAAGISTTETVTNNTAHPLINILPENMQASVNNYTKTIPNTMSLQQALAQILPPVLNQNGETNQQGKTTSVNPQVLHIVQGKNTQGNHITLVDNSQQSVINAPNSTPVLHFVQNKGTPANSNTNGNIQTNAFSGLSLVDTGLQQGGNPLLQIVNTGNQKNSNTSQLLKQVNLLTNLTNVQGSNEQKMVQFLCKSADGKAIQLNGPHPRGMVLRIQPVESPNIQQANPSKPLENQDLSPTTNLGNHTPNKEATSQQEIKSRSMYEENYAKFIQNSSAKQVIPEKSTSLPKFNQAFGKQGYQDGEQKQNEINATNSHLPSLNTSSENAECPPSENTLKLDHIGQMSSPPLLLRKSPAQTTQPQPNFVPQMKQTISPINIQSMHGSVIYRQIPVNLGGGQTINLITVPNTEVNDDANQKQQSDVKYMSQNEMDQSIIKIVPQNQPAPNVEVQQQEENNQHINLNNDNGSNSQQPVLTQMRIKLPMLSKTPQMVSGARVVRPSFFQIQRNVIGANQQVFQQLVLTAAPPMGHQAAIRLPQTQNVRQLKVANDNPTSSESQMSSSTLEQLREFDLVLEQVKERSTVQPNANTTSPFSQLHATNDTTDSVIATNSVSTEPTQQVLYSIGNSQPLNMSYVSRKSTIPTPTTSTYVRSPDSSGIIDSPPSSSHIQIPHTITSDSTTNDTPVHHKPTKNTKPKPRPKASSNPPNTLKLNTVPPKTSTQKPLEDEQTTQRILYILAEYKEQVENSPDKDKPAPRRRTNLPPNPGSSKRKKSSSNSRRPGGRDLSPVHGDDTCRTMGSEDSSCGTSQGDCNDCLESHSPQESPRKVVRKLSFEQETPLNVQRQVPQRNVIVADGQTITVARGTTGKPTTAVLMPANYILPVSMVKGGQQIAIVTNRGPKLLTVTSGEGGTTNALLLQRLITPAGLKPVLTRPGVRHVRLPAAALHSLQAFNLAPVTNIHPPDSTVSPAPAPTPPELVDTRANTSPWTERDSQEAKPDRGSSPEGSEPWNLPTHADPNDYSYEETVRTDNMDRTVLDPIPDRYSPDMEAQRIFDKMFDVDSKKSYMIDSHADSPRCGYDIDTSDCDDKAYHQIVHKKEGTLHRQHRLSHVSAAALRHKYAILEHELRLQKSLSEECEDLGVDSPSASELFPEAELLFAASPSHDNTQEQGQNSHSNTPQPVHSCISQPDIEDQIATDQLLPREQLTEQQELQLGLEDVGIVTVSEDGLQTTIALDHEEFARAHPNTTFHSEPTDDTDMQPFTITGIKGRHITSTIFHSHRPTGTVLMTAPQTTVISQAIGEGTSVPNTVKYSDIENMIDALPSVHENNLPSVLVKDDGISRFDSILTDSRELHLSNTASAIVHSTGNAAQVIRRVCCEDNKRDRDVTYLVDDSHPLIAGDDAKLMTEDTSRDGTMESMHGGVEEDRSSPERHTELFWESNSASERSESRRPLDFSSDSDKCCKSPFEETNSTDSGGVGSHLRLDSVIKEARGLDRSHGADCSSADDTHHPPLRTYPPKRLYHSMDGELDRSLSGKTSVGDLEVRRRASARGVVKRGCQCCNGSPAPPRPKKSRQKKLIATDFTTN